MKQLTIYILLLSQLLVNICSANEDSWKNQAILAFECLFRINEFQNSSCNKKVSESAGQSAIKVSKEDLSVLENTRPISRLHFEKYCQQCHQQWPLNDDEKFKTMVKGMGQSMIFQLEHKLMPKPSSERPISDKMRLDLIQFLKTNSK